MVPEWIEVGGKVGIESLLYRGFEYTLATIERLTATLVILQEGGRERRFRIKDLREVGKSYGRKLVPADDPRIKEYFADVLAVQARRNIDDLRKTRISGQALMNRMREILDDTQAKIDKLI